MTNRKISPLSKPWVQVVACFVGALTLLFMMGLVLLGIFGYQVPCDSRYLTSIVLSLGASLATGFLTGSASAKGNLSLPGSVDSPIVMTATGGIATLVLMLIVTSLLLPRKDGCDPISISCPDGMQARLIERHGFGFCYPRVGWELDDKALSEGAADIYVRNSRDPAFSIHFHVSVVPGAFVGRQKDYAKRTADTWRQVDKSLLFEEDLLNGQRVYDYSFSMRDDAGNAKRVLASQIFLTDELLLELFLTYPDRIDDDKVTTLQRIRSTVRISSR